MKDKSFLFNFSFGRNGKPTDTTQPSTASWSSPQASSKSTSKPVAFDDSATSYRLTMLDKLASRENDFNTINAERYLPKDDSGNS